MKLTGGTAEETILAAEPPEEASEKPKSEQKVEPKVQKPKAEPKATEKTENTPKMGKAKSFLCYFPPATNSPSPVPNCAENADFCDSAFRGIPPPASVAVLPRRKEHPAS